MLNSIRGKLLTSLSVVLVLTAALGGITYYYVTQNGKLVSDAINRDFNGSIAMSRLAVEAQKIRRYEKEYFMYIGNAKKETKYEKEWRDSYYKITDMLNSMLRDVDGIWSAREKEMFREWADSLVFYGDGFKRVVSNVKMRNIGDTLSANRAIQEAKNRFRVLVKGAARVSESKFETAAASERQISESNDVLIRVLSLATGIAVLICALIMVLVPIGIISPIRLLSDAADSISKGDLDRPVPSAVGVMDFRGLAATLERMRVSQKAMLERLSRA